MQSKVIIPQKLSTIQTNSRTIKAESPYDGYSQTPDDYDFWSANDEYREGQEIRNAGVQYIAFIVNTIKDENDGINDGEISLRDAIAALPSSGTGEIIFADDLFNGNSAQINLSLGQLNIDKSLTIDAGSGRTLTIKQNDNNSRVFDVNDGNSGTSIPVTFKSLNITGGKSSSYGGGISNSENLTISNSTISGNSAARGGGIYINSGNLALNNSTVSGNTTVNGGGGIYINSGNLALNNSTVSGNTAANGGGGIYSDSITTLTNSTISGNSTKQSGGGIYSSNLLTIKNSTISDNSSEANGGGVYHTNNTLTIENSTISGNSAKNGNGGGIDSYQSKVNITNVTISGNSAKANGGAVVNNQGTLTLKNSTITKNTANNGSGVYFNGASNSSYTTTIESSIISGNANNNDVVAVNTEFFISNGYNLLGGGTVNQAPLTKDINKFGRQVIDTSQNAIGKSDFALITDAAAKALNNKQGNGLPNNGFFAANKDHPDVQLPYGLNQGGNNARISGAEESFKFSVATKTYKEVHLFAISTEGSSSMNIEFTYTDGTKAYFNKKTVPTPFPAKD